jgi:hypothetical protein
MPLGESMICSLKNNRGIMLDKTKHFRKTIGRYGKKEKQEYSFPKVTLQILKEIKEKVKQENKQIFKKRLALFLVVVGLIVSVLLIFGNKA